MDNRRDFLKKIMLLTGAAGVASLPPSIAKAIAIDPALGSTYLDAEHIVILMQENRSFDHMFGALRGVRGFSDPRTMSLPNNNAAWLQTNEQNETYAPFRFDIKDTKITWMGSLPHSRKSQVGARNEGRMDNWIEAKKSGEEEYKDMPLTMGYYTREDIPFYYALADAFTVCDQNFCSSLTPTDPNRLYFWSGTVRPELNEDAKAFVDNDDIEKGVEWRTFPELLEQNNVSWKVYQNEVSVGVGLTEEEDEWLGNFGDNPLEFFNQYHVKLIQRYIDYLPKQIIALQEDIQKSEVKLQALPPADKEYGHLQKDLQYRKQALSAALSDKEKYTADAFQKLSDHHKQIHQKAFVVNENDPYRHQLTPLNYTDETISREINIPKGDVLHQFRHDVKNNALPVVSWLAAPQNFSDHPSAPWFGAWYVSEVMDILTQDPEVWKKTIFILAYDENDGYFDHVPPFTAPKHSDATSGAVSTGIDTRPDHVKLAEDHPGSIGLGFRVPLIIASPWSRGGWVNSQVFDHTSTIQFLETFLNKKFGKNIEETNITPWRRTVCGDLTSTFQQYDKQKITGLPFVPMAPFVETIHKAKFRNVPSNYKKLSAEEIAQVNQHPQSSPYMPQQEEGIRPACVIPYELYADGNSNHNTGAFEITLQAANKVFKSKAAGSPFIVFLRRYQQQDFREKNYAVAAGDTLKDTWMLHDFDNGEYHLEVYAPNGFYRKFAGSSQDPLLLTTLLYETEIKNNLTGNVKLVLDYQGNEDRELIITDHAYKKNHTTLQLTANAKPQSVVLDLTHSYGWYDFGVKMTGNDKFEKRYAGHVETSKVSKSDPMMGMVNV